MAKFTNNTGVAIRHGNQVIQPDESVDFDTVPRSLALMAGGTPEKAAGKATGGGDSKVEGGGAKGDDKAPASGAAGASDKGGSSGKSGS